MEKNESLIKVGDDLKSESQAYIIAAQNLVVTNDRELEDADGNLKGIKTLIRKIKEWFKPHKTKARDVLNGLTGEEKKLLDPLYETEEIIKGKMGPYMEEQKRKQEEAEAAARKAREEAEEAARRAEEYAAAAARAAEEEKQRKAREALQDGERKEAEKILAKEPEVFIPEVEDVPAPKEIVIPQAKKLKGSYPRTDWKWELENIDQVPRVLSNGKRPLTLDRSVITAHVEKYHEQKKIPGIRVFSETTMVTRGK